VVDGDTGINEGREDEKNESQRVERWHAGEEYLYTVGRDGSRGKKRGGGVLVAERSSLAT
jgi:hypothetical protein